MHICSMLNGPLESSLGWRWPVDQCLKLDVKCHIWCWELYKTIQTVSESSPPSFGKKHYRLLPRETRRNETRKEHCWLGATKNRQAKNESWEKHCLAMTVKKTRRQEEPSGKGVRNGTARFTAHLLCFHAVLGAVRSVIAEPAQSVWQHF